MGDINQAGKNWLVSPTQDVDDMWMKVRIQEKRSLLAGYKRSILESEQKIQDLRDGIILDLNAKSIMVEKEISFLELKLEGDKPIDV